MNERVNGEREEEKGEEEREEEREEQKRKQKLKLVCEVVIGERGKVCWWEKEITKPTNTPLF